jgi:hypothetical protein
VTVGSQSAWKVVYTCITIIDTIIQNKYTNDAYTPTHIHLPAASVPGSLSGVAGVAAGAGTAAAAAAPAGTAGTAAPAPYAPYAAVAPVLAVAAAVVHMRYA